MSHQAVVSAPIRLMFTDPGIGAVLGDDHADTVRRHRGHDVGIVEPPAVQTVDEGEPPQPPGHLGDHPDTSSFSS